MVKHLQGGLLIDRWHSCLRILESSGPSLSKPLGRNNSHLVGM